MRGFLAALGLLTRIPVGSGDRDESDLARSVAWLPVVGAAIGLASAGAYVLLLGVLPDLTAAAVSTTFGVLVTGALHEDGLADTADAFGAGAGREETLRIMKDPTHGSFGVIALTLSVVLRVLAVGALTASTALLIVPVAHALGRAGAIGVMAWLPPATGDGLGAAHSHSRSTRSALLGGLSAVAIGMALLGWWVAAFALVAIAGALLVGLLARRRISGYTGDVLGAVEQVIEVSLLLFGAGLARAGLVSQAWWSP